MMEEAIDIMKRYIPEYNLEDLVYLKTDSDQAQRLVTAISIRQNGVTYGLSCGTCESFHYAFEMTVNRDILKTTDN